MRKNYYVVLGISKDATTEEIRRAYRRLAKQFHPDTGQVSSHERFVQIREAYEVLIDNGRRNTYDDIMRQKPQDIRVKAKTSRSVRTPPCTYLSAQLILSAKEARYGGYFRAEIPLSSPCATCSGTGIWRVFRCPHCYGHAYTRHTCQVQVPPKIENNSCLTTNIEINGGKVICIHFHVQIYH